jgi:hypothetical protein
MWWVIDFFDEDTQRLRVLIRIVRPKLWNDDFVGT